MTDETLNLVTIRNEKEEVLALVPAERLDIIGAVMRATSDEGIRHLDMSVTTLHKVAEAAV